MALCPAPSVLVFFLIYRRRQVSQASNRPAFGQSRRRPPGESLRIRLEEIDQQINEWMVYLAICPAVVGLAGGLIRLPGIGLPAALFLISVTWAGLCAWRLFRLNRERRETDLAFDGRRHVAEELNRLTAEGFEVYHDVPLDGVNIDHVLLGPPGLYAIETKTRSRNGGATAQEQVEFDGFRVSWPTGSESYGLERAATNARTLAKWLSSGLGESIEATPVLTLPGWTIECKAANQSVLVLNAKEIGKLCDSKTVRLEEDLIRRICQQLNRKCAAGG